MLGNKWVSGGFLCFKGNCFNDVGKMKVFPLLLLQHSFDWCDCLFFIIQITRHLSIINICHQFTFFCCLTWIINIKPGVVKNFYSLPLAFKTHSFIQSFKTKKGLKMCQHLSFSELLKDMKMTFGCNSQLKFIQHPKTKLVIELFLLNFESFKMSFLRNFKSD